MTAMKLGGFHALEKKIRDIFAKDDGEVKRKAAEERAAREHENLEREAAERRMRAEHEE